MTGSQLLAHHSHDGKIYRYDKISIFSLRPPELLGVFLNPLEYYQSCVIDEKDTQGTVEAGDKLCSNLLMCSWIDCFGRKIKIHKLAFVDVEHLAHTNIQEYRAILNHDERIDFCIKMNEIVLKLIKICKKYETGETLGNE